MNKILDILYIITIDIKCLSLSTKSSNSCKFTLTIKPCSLYIRNKQVINSGSSDSYI